jgi:16S rRNA processing protein RimM
VRGASTAVRHVPPEGERLVVALVRGLHGLRGGVRVEVLTDETGRFEPGSVLYPEGTDVPLTVEWAQPDEPGLLVRFEERRSREAVEALRDVYLEAIAPPSALGEGAYWWHEVEGATVTSVDGRELGRVEEVFRAGGGEVFVVRGEAYGELLVPAVSAVVREFAPREGRLVVDVEALDLDERPRRRRGRRSSRCEGPRSRGEELAEEPAEEPRTPE